MTFYKVYSGGMVFWYISHSLPRTHLWYGSPAVPGGQVHTGRPCWFSHSAPSPQGLLTEQGSDRHPDLRKHITAVSAILMSHMLLCIWIKHILYCSPKTNKIPAIWTACKSPKASANRTLSASLTLSIQSAWILATWIKSVCFKKFKVFIDFLTNYCYLINIWCKNTHKKLPAIDIRVSCVLWWTFAYCSISWVFTNCILCTWSGRAGVKLTVGIRVTRVATRTLQVYLFQW